SKPATFERWIEQRVDRKLRDRALAARILSATADGLSPELAARAAGSAQRLASHPDTLVWIPAARALGRLAAHGSAARTLVFEWLGSDNAGERRRATTALGSMPGDGWHLEARIQELFAADDDRWAVAALGQAIPYLIVERREIWD